MTTPATPAETISHYRLLELLGRGAMGEVWLAEDTQLPRKVAVKLLPRDLSLDRDAVGRLLREAQAAASVDHPAVVTVYEAGLTEGRPYLVMQRVEGETLEKRLTRGPLPVEEATALATRIADALAEVHALGIVHRDLKPSNIILTPRGPKLLDFGVASVKGSPRLTASGVAVGTPLAMSPEQVKGLPPDNRSDLWGLGVTLYESLTGSPPFRGDSLEAVTYELLNRQPPAPGTLRREVGPDLDYIVMKLLRKDPAHRYSRAEDLLADLASCAAGSGKRKEARAADAKPAIPRLAVLYFELLSAEADDAYLAAGLVEDLIVDLTQVGGVQVASRADVVPFRDRPLPPRTLARELGVDYVLSGSVRRAGNRARISAQLVRAGDGHTVWAERFDRTLEDLFDVQAEVSKRIVEALQVALKPGEREMLERAPTRSKEGYAFYLRARELLGKRSRDSLASAEELLRRALELDPDFALAHAALGECYARKSLAWYAGLETAEPALACARRALQLEPDLFEGHLVMGMAHRIKGEHEQLLQVFDRLMAINPDHLEAMIWMGWSYLTLGRPEAALKILEPCAQRYQDNYIAASWLNSAYAMLGRPEDAHRAALLTRDRAIEMLRREPENVHARSVLAGMLADLGEREAGIEQMERTVALAPDDARIRYNAACMYAKLGLTERAIAELREGTKNLPSYLVDWPKRDPDLASLHDHPEFVRLFGRVEKGCRPARAPRPRSTPAAAGSAGPAFVTRPARPIPARLRPVAPGASITGLASFRPLPGEHTPMRAIRLSVFTLLVLAAALAAAAPAAAAKPAKSSKSAPPAKSLLEGLELFQVGAAHSSIEFSVAWMGISRVRGAFTDFSGTLALDRADLTRSSATIVIRTKSLTTFNERRDRDLKGADWFDVENFPTAVFASREIVKDGDGYLLRGSLTLHGVTKEIGIPFTYNGSLKDPGGDERVGFEGRVALNRKDYGIVGQARFNAIMEIGKAMVGDQIELPLAVEGIRTTPKDTLQDRTADSLWRAIVARGVAPVAKQYRELRATTPDSLMPVNEFRLNAVGAQLVDRGRAADALEVFKLQAEAYPQSASGLAGMAYACATLGDREQAIANADKAVAMNPAATRALEILRRARVAPAN